MPITNQNAKVTKCPTLHAARYDEDCEGLYAFVIPASYEEDKQLIKEVTLGGY